MKYLDDNGVLYLWNKIKAIFVQKESGKGLSTNDFTTAEKNKLAGIAAGANKNVNADWNATNGDALILNKPTKVSQFTNDANYQTESQVTSAINNKLSSVMKYKGTVANYSDLPKNAIVGDTYNITNASANNEAGDNAVWNGTNWDVLSGTIDLSNYATISQLNNKQDKLVSGTNIKSINGESLLGKGDLSIEGVETLYSSQVTDFYNIPNGVYNWVQENEEGNDSMILMANTQQKYKMILFLGRDNVLIRRYSSSTQSEELANFLWQSVITEANITYGGFTEREAIEDDGFGMKVPNIWSIYNYLQDYIKSSDMQAITNAEIDVIVGV